MSIETASVRAGARTRDAPPQLKQPFVQAFQAARAAGAEPEWRPAAQPSEHRAYFVGKAGAHSPVVPKETTGSWLGVRKITRVLDRSHVELVMPCRPLVASIPTCLLSCGAASLPVCLQPFMCCRRRHRHGLRRSGCQGTAAHPAGRHSLQAGTAGQPGCGDAGLPGRHECNFRYAAFPPTRGTFTDVTTHSVALQFAAEPASPTSTQLLQEL